MKKLIWQFLIAVDQLLNVLAWAKGEGFGFADETLSARCWRLRTRRAWNFARSVLDYMFFFDKHEGERAHCFLAWLAEFERHHLPEEYKEFSRKYGPKKFTRRLSEDPTADD